MGAALLPAFFVRLTLQQLPSHLAKGLAPVYVIAGEEPLLVQEALERVGDGWRWSADPEIRHKTKLGSNLTGLIPRAGCPLMFIRGALSTTVSDEIWAEHQALAPGGTPFVIIPDAHHHVMIDQPIALIAVLRALLATLA